MTEFNRVLTMNSDPVITSFKVFESDPPEKEYKRLRIAEYNIISGGGSQLYMALRAMAQMRVELGVFCETKLTNDMYPRECCGYSVFATQAKSHSQGGVALFYRSNASQWTIEGTRTHGPNVLSCSLVTGSRRFSLLCVYIPPSEDDGETLTYLEEAVRTRCNHPIILLGDLNINLPRPIDDRSEDIATALTLLGLSDLSDYFPASKGRWTWSQIHGDRYLRSTTDYILSDTPDAFSRWAVKCPRGYSSDHRALIAELGLARTASHRRYLRHRRRFPVRLAQPLSLEDTVFAELTTHRHPPVTRNPRDKSWISDPTWQLIDRKSTLSSYLTHHNSQLCLKLHGSPSDFLNMDSLTTRFQTLSLQDASIITLPSDPIIDDLILRFQTLRISSPIPPNPYLPRPCSSPESSHLHITVENSDGTPLCIHQCEYKRLGKAIRRALRHDR
jgi:hypothetical protein